MKKLLTVLGILGGVLTLACSTMTTAVDYDHTINWSQFHSFQLADGTKDPVTFVQKRIEDAITSTLTSKGWSVASIRLSSRPFRSIADNSTGSQALTSSLSAASFSRSHRSKS